jgi:hypothetical protein
MKVLYIKQWLIDVPEDITTNAEILTWCRESCSLGNFDGDEFVDMEDWADE